MPGKPDKYGIRFYACVGSQPGAYLHSMFDNRSGNTMGQSPAAAYLQVFPALKPVYAKLLTFPHLVDPLSASALWLLQMCHQSVKAPRYKRLFVSDNFYTWHTLAIVLKALTGGNTCLLGTINMNLVDATNWIHLQEAIMGLADAPQGHWKLVRVYDKVKNIEE